MAIIEGTVVGSEAGFYPTEIEQSLRFNDDDSAYLSWTPASAGNRKTWTFSTWVKRGNIGSEQIMFAAGPNASGPRAFFGFQGTSDALYGGFNDGSTWSYITTNALFRDTSAWYHVMFVQDLTNATTADRAIIYVNGIRQSVSSTGSFPNADQTVNNTVEHRIGSIYGTSYVTGTDGYLAETHFIDGTAYDATAFGEFKNGVWIPKTPSVTYGTNGFYLDYSNGASIGADSSGNSNNWTPTNLASTDVMLDSPTNNFATLNSIKKGLDSTYSEGNLKVSYGSSSSVSGDFATIGMSSGKWYWEWAPTGGTAPTNSVVGIVNTTENSSVSSGIGYYPSYTTNGWAYTGFDGNKQNGAGTSTAYGATFTSTDIVGVAFDADAGELEFYKNGVSQGVAYTGLSSDTYYPAFGDGSELNTVIGVANFGQDSSFAGNKTPQGYTDANGIGDFYYAPPAGYLALCTANLPEPAIGPNSATTADENFNTVLWTGDGTSPRSITGVGFQPDLVWTKRRSGADSHHLFDVVRGTAVELRSDGTGAELTSTYGNLSSYDTDGFTVTAGANGNENQNSSGYTCVAWNWKADNTSGSTNTDGTITSTVSANVDAGFSIVSYTGTGSAATVGHGLSSAPEVVLIKNRSTTDTWAWYTTVIDGSNDFLSIDDTAAKADASEGVPTSTIFNVSGWSGNNGSGNALIAYCFHSVEGYSKFGSYTGNGSTDGPFVYTGFRPAFVMVKCTNTTGDWLLYDTERDTYNVGTKYLIANSSTSEGTVAYIDTLSNGFKLKLAGGGVNTSGNNYIFMSFASNPFKYSNAR